MSLLDKSIKNSVFSFISQISGMIFPIILTPFIISKIGSEQFAIYALVFGFIGGASLMDFSISSAFIKYISEHYYKQQYFELNKVINTGTFFYILFSSIILILGYFFSNSIVLLVNIPIYLTQKAIFAFYIGLTIFFMANVSSVYSAIITSLQKMYITSISWFLINFLNTLSIVLLLILGFGLSGVLISQFISYVIYFLLIIYFAFKNLKEYKFSIFFVDFKTFKNLFSFGIQLQVSKLSTFASEKYDEFLLAFFSVLNKVTFYNIGARLSRSARFVPLQIIPQVAPVAAELNSRKDTEKLTLLFSDTSRYISIISLPIFAFLFLFSKPIIFCWVGDEYNLSSYILRILLIGQFINIMFSVPGNSITPNVGIPKFQMREGLISLFSNLILSFLLIKYYGIVGAAWGNTISASISSIYVFYVSSGFFKFNDRMKFIKNSFFVPTISTIFIGCLFYLVYFFFIKYALVGSGRVLYLVSILSYFLIFFVLCILSFELLGYFKDRDKKVFTKILIFMFPFKFLIKSLGE
jgi:O-antigen/teichoic acid export membrane protein